MQKIRALVAAGLIFSLLPAAAANELDWVPADAAGFVRLLPVDLWNNLPSDHRAVLSRVQPESQRLFEKQLGLTVAEVKRLTMVFPNLEATQKPLPSGQPEGMSGVLIVSMAKPFDRAKLFGAAAIGGRTKTAQGHTYAFNEDLWSALCPVDATTFLFGSEDAVLWLLQQKGRPKGRGPLSGALELAGGTSPVVIGFNARVIPPGLAQAMPPPLQPLFQAETALITVDLAKELVVTARLDFPQEKQAAAGAQAVRAALALARQGLAGPRQELEKGLAQKNFDESIVFLYGLGLLRLYDDFLKDFPIEQKNSQVQVSLKTREFPGGALVSSVVAITMLGKSANATFAFVEGGDPQPPPNMLQIGKALESYRQAQGSYPPPAILGKNGEPLLSWRVALLPYLDEQELYKEFKLDEPWDSLHNRKLLTRMPKVFSAPFLLKTWKTTYQVFVGPGAIFEGPKGCRQADITDGLATTILLARVSEDKAIAWTKPGDLAFDATKPLWHLINRYPFGVLFADGSSHRFNQVLQEQTLRALITRNGGEKVTLPGK